MKIAVISDIHGNMDAFQAVLTDIDSNGLDAVISLGDMIGYGAQPETVLAEVRRRRMPALMGNHELAVVDPSYLNWFNDPARQSLQKSIIMLSPDSIQYVSGLKPFLLMDQYYFVHGYPPKSPLIYLFQVSNEKLIQTFLESEYRFYFIGHTHALELISFDGLNIRRLPLREGITRLEKENRYMINIGSVGQPRDGNNCAKYAILDSETDTIDIRFIPYDFRAAADKIIAAGLPAVHAKRLY